MFWLKVLSAYAATTPLSICMSRMRFGLRCHVQDRWHSCEFVSLIIVFPHRVRGHSTDSSAFAGKQGCCAVPTALPCALPAPVPATAELPAGAMAGARCSQAWHTQPSTTYIFLRLTDHRTRHASSNGTLRENRDPLTPSRAQGPGLRLVSHRLNKNRYVPLRTCHTHLRFNFVITTL